MPQEHYVLKCFSCETFQAHIVKKSKKWECKICGSKQSFKRNYGKGSGQDCRRQVMKLNELRLTNKNVEEQTMCELLENVIDSNTTEEFVTPERPSISKWSAYLADEDDFLRENLERDEKTLQNQTADFHSVLCKTDNYSHADEKSQMIESGKYTVENKGNSFNIFESDFNDIDNLLNF